MAGADGGEGLFAALKRLAATVVAIGRTRLELLATEVEEEKLRVSGILAYGAAAVCFLGLGILTGVACLAAAFWEQRVLVLGLAAFVLVAIAGICGARGMAVARRGSPLFRASLAELDADLDRLKGREGS